MPVNVPSSDKLGTLAVLKRTEVAQWLMDVTAIAIAALSSSALTAVLMGLVSNWTAMLAAKRQQRIGLLARWRSHLEAYADSTNDPLTDMPWYAEMHSILHANNIDLEGVEGRTTAVPPSGYHGNPAKRSLQTAVAKLARKWGLD